MLPVVAGRTETRRQILLYSIVLVPLGAAPWLLGYAGALYGVTALVARRADGRAGLARCAASATRRADKAAQAAVRLLDPLSLHAVRRAAGRERLGSLLGRAAA